MEKCCNENVKIIDCTIRDGGLINYFRFEDELVKNVYSTCIEAGIDYMEIGHMASEEYISYNDFGKWKFCKEDEIRKILGEKKSNLKLSVGADAIQTNKKNILLKNKSIIDMIRTEVNIDQIEEGLEMIKYVSDKGYETCLNLTDIANTSEKGLDKALEVISKSEVSVVYIVDGLRTLKTEDIKELTLKYIGYLKGEGKQVGIHAHESRQRPYANTLEAIRHGATFVDASMAGLGRGVGNCLSELVLGYIKSDKYEMKPVIKCIQDHILPLKLKIS